MDVTAAPAMPAPPVAIGGFGLANAVMLAPMSGVTDAPFRRLAAQVESVSQPRVALRYRIESRGWLTDVDGLATLRVPAAAFDAVIVSLRRGNIRVEDLTGSHVVARGRVRLELRTTRGHIQRPG